METKAKPFDPEAFERAMGFYREMIGRGIDAGLQTLRALEKLGIGQAVERLRTFQGAAHGESSTVCSTRTG